MWTEFYHYCIQEARSNVQYTDVVIMAEEKAEWPIAMPYA